MTNLSEIQLPQGTIRYRKAGSGPPIVFVHGYLVGGRLWDGVVEALADRYRCIAPEWPMGSHPVAMKPDTDLSPPGIATIIEGFLAALGLEDVTLVGNDSGGALCQVLVARRPARVGRLVLTNCEPTRTSRPGSSRPCRRWRSSPAACRCSPSPCAAPPSVGLPSDRSRRRSHPPS